MLEALAEKEVSISLTKLRSVRRFIRVCFYLTQTISCSVEQHNSVSAVHESGQYCFRSEELCKTFIVS